MEDKNKCSKSIPICNICDFYDAENQFCPALCIDCYPDECVCILFHSSGTIKL